nr:GNAT family N-acetyltransferase [Halovivax sp. TS33]
MTIRIRPYESSTDRTALWSLKREFELGLGSGTGGDEKAQVYREKLTDEYREGYLEWVDRCAEACPTAVTVAEAEREGSDGDEHDSGGGPTATLVGYVFVLPDSFAYVWDAAVLNELFVAESHRGTGVADDLMDAAVDTAREQDLPLERLVLDVDCENDRARAFYRRHGFDHWGELVARSLSDPDSDSSSDS